MVEPPKNVNCGDLSATYVTALRENYHSPMVVGILPDSYDMSDSKVTSNEADLSLIENKYNSIFIS